MTMTYRTTGDWGSGKGSNLTPAEVDTNFWTLSERITAIETDPPAAAGISNITVTGTQMTVTLSDSTVFGPFTLPTATFQWRGEWAAATSYAELDLVRVSGVGLFVVLEDHISDPAFDANASSSAGLHYLQVYPDERSNPVAEISAATHEPDAADATYYFRCTNVGGCVVTLGETIPVAAEITYRQCAAGAVSFVAGGSGVVINGVDGYLDETAGPGSVVTVKCVAAGEYDLIGLLALEP